MSAPAMSRHLRVLRTTGLVEEEHGGEDAREGVEVTGASGDGASATVLVSVPPDVGFEVFTKEVDLWWKQGPRYRIGGKRRGRLVFEPGVGGRLWWGELLTALREHAASAR